MTVSATATVRFTVRARDRKRRGNETAPPGPAGRISDCCLETNYTCTPHYCDVSGGDRHHILWSAGRGGAAKGSFRSKGLGIAENGFFTFSFTTTTASSPRCAMQPCTWRGDLILDCGGAPLSPRQEDTRREISAFLPKDLMEVINILIHALFGK